MKRAWLHSGFLLAFFLATTVLAGCDSNTEDEFRDFEGSWTVADLKEADDDGERLTSIFSRLDDEYNEVPTFTFSESDGVEQFEIFARRDKADTQNLNVSGDVQFSSGNDMTLIGNFVGRESVLIDKYRFVDDQLVLTADDFDGQSMLETLLPNRSTNPETPVIELTLEQD